MNVIHQMKTCTLLVILHIRLLHILRSRLV